jgi:hypothetical protein
MACASIVWLQTANSTLVVRISKIRQLEKADWLSSSREGTSLTVIEAIGVTKIVPCMTRALAN